MAEKGEVVLEVRDMSKNFGATIALNHVDIQLRTGEMFYKGKPWKPKTMLEASEHGIGMIVQEAGTIESITVAENIFLGNSKKFMKGPFVDKKAMVKKAQEALNQVGITGISAALPTRLLDMQERKLVEVAKVMCLNPDILIVDETTTALSQNGREILYKIMHKMADEGKTVFIISYDMEEMMNECDVLTILRDGVILLSKHLRYTFSTMEDTISLEAEIGQCKNYVDLFSINQQEEAVLYTNYDVCLTGLPIPPISILTFVENSVKYGFIPGKRLEIKIGANRVLQGTIYEAQIQKNGVDTIAL